MCSQTLGLSFFLRPTSNRGDFESHMPGELHPEMPQTPDALNSHDVVRTRAGLPQRAECGHTRTEQRGSFNRVQLIGNGGKSARFCDHILRVPTVKMSARPLLAKAINEVSFSAKAALSAVSAQEPHAHAL